MRNYDIPTALSVLTTGTYSALPSVIRETFGVPEKLSDEVVDRTIRELEDVLRWRLSCVEVLPKEMMRYQICECLEAIESSEVLDWEQGGSAIGAYKDEILLARGQVSFKVEGLWEASMTYGGDSSDTSAEWYILNLAFLFRVKDSRGGMSFSFTLLFVN